MPPASAFKSVEMVDLNALKLIVSNWDTLPIDPEAKKEWKMGRKVIQPLAAISAYLYNCKLNKFKAHATKACLYYHSSNSPDEGRRYVKDAGLQSFPRQIRHTLAHRFYDDIDIRNAHPTIMVQYCEQKGYDVKYLKRYIDNRDELLGDMMEVNNITKEQAKKVVLAIINGGSADYNQLAQKPSWLTYLKLQVETIQEHIVNDPDNARFVKRARTDKGNINGSATNHLLCSIEDKILQLALKFVQSKGGSLDNVVLVFDGFMLPKNMCTLNDQLFAEMTQYIHNACGFSVEFCLKPMDEVMDLSGMTMSVAATDDIIVVHDDDGAAAVFIERHGDIVKKSNGRIFVFGRDHTWNNNNSIVDSVLLDTCLKSNIYKRDEKDRPKPYSGNVKSAKNVIEAVKVRLVDDPTFSKQLWSGSIGKLFFRDGYWDFKKAAFVASVAPDDSMTTIRLSYDFPERNDAKMKEVREKLLDTIMPDKAVCKTMLAHIARALAGHFEDKDWLVGMGERNSGKGVLVGACENAFENYCISLISDSF